MKDDVFEKLKPLLPTGERDPSFPDVPPPGPDLENYLNHSLVPNVKSVRRQLFGNPGLLYYLTELGWIYYKLLQRNLDYLVDFLKDDGALRMLNIFHTFMGNSRVLQGFERYATLAGTRRIKAFLTHEEPFFKESVLHNVLSFSTMDPVAATVVYDSREKFEGFQIAAMRFGSRPVTIYPAIPDLKVEGFWFHQILTTGEMRRLGQQLKNCLDEMPEQSRPVWGIYDVSTGRAIGAFQVKKRRSGYSLVQAHAASNSKLPRNCVRAMHSYLDKYMPGWRERDFHFGVLDRWLLNMAAEDERPRFPILDEDEKERG